MRYTVIFACLLAAGCATTSEPAVDVNKAVMTPCLGKTPIRPVYRFDDLPAAVSAEDEADQVRVLWKDRAAAIEYGDKWEAAAAGCAVLASSPESVK